MHIRQMLFFISLIAASQDVAGREYRTSALCHAAAVLGIEHQIDDAPKGMTTNITPPSGTTIAVRIDSEGTVEHIGLPLFSNGIRQQSPSPVYDCMEYAALDRLFIITENDLLLQKIIFIKGAWKSIMGIKPSDTFSLSAQDDKNYQLVWSRNSNEIIKVIMPVDYELLSGSSRRELEQSFVRNVSHHRAVANFRPTKDINSKLVKSDIEVDIQLSNYAHHIINVTLRQWLSYCESQGCTSDIKYDDSDELSSKSYVMSYNTAMGYHHFLELNRQTDSHSKMKGKALLFIPNYDKI